MSSPCFKTPILHSAAQLDHSISGLSSHLNSLSRNSIVSSSSDTHLPKQKRVSFSPSRSHNSSHSAPSLNHGEAGEIESDSDIQRREDEDAMNEIVMAIDMKNKGTLGCAYYIAREERLCLTEDIKMASLDIIDTLKLHIQPTVLIISSRAEEELEGHLIKEARPLGRGDHDSKSYGSITQIYITN
jgi:DNA mismatch repair protein MSH5